MANQEQLEILKQGVEVWNKWREENHRPEHIKGEFGILLNAIEEPDLSGADLSGYDLKRANLSETNLIRTNFSGANLMASNFSGADFNGAVLIGAKLNAADFAGANLSDVNLSRADLSKTKFGYADLINTVLNETNLIGSDFSDAELSATIFGNLDLSNTIGLEDVLHIGPSTIGTDTIAKSKGNIPEVFLQGCGLSDWEIEQVKLYNPDLSNDKFIDIQNRIFDLRNRQAIQLNPLFVSYNHTDSEFVDKIGAHLTEKGIRYWRDIHHATAGRLEKQIDRAIRRNPTVLLILSENSIQSDWVEHEVRTARELEKELGRDTLCPVALDESWKDSPWPKRVMEQVMEYNILDFSEWEEDVKFEGMFRKLIDGLELFYKG